MGVIHLSVQHSFMRNANTRAILNYIRIYGASTRREIQAATGLSWGAVSTITAELLAQEQLIETRKTTPVSGRVPSLLDFNLSKNLSIGVEINIEGITIVLVDVRNNILCAKEEMLDEAERDAVLRQLKRMLKDLLRENKLSNSHLLGIGIAIQGLVDRSGSISRYNHYIQNWTNVPLKSILEEYFNLPVSVIHDPICIALAQEQQNHRLRDQDFILIRLAYGIGMCYMHEGKPIPGFEGIAGELGHLVVDIHGRPCSCGNRGCLEAYCSIRGIAQGLYNLLKDDPQYTLSPPSGSDVNNLNHLMALGIKLAQNGNPDVQKIFSEAGTYLGQGVVNLIHLLNPRYIVLTGAVMDASEFFMPQVMSCIREHTCYDSQVELLAVRESRRCASLGAALKFINEAFESD